MQTSLKKNGNLEVHYFGFVINGISSMPCDIDDGIENGTNKNKEKIINAILANPMITQKNHSNITILSMRTVAR